ncbi:MAG: GAP family protein [Cyanobacteriota bacterium]|nr:GAP family protein [Cyanobacteriota bacterium]
MAHELGELSALAIALGLTPLHISLLLLVLLGPSPLRRGVLFVGTWLVTSGLALPLLLLLGHGLTLEMGHGKPHHVLLDLAAATGLLLLGLREAMIRETPGQAPAWTERLNQFCALPLPVLLAMSIGLQLSSPGNLLIYTEAAGSILSARLGPDDELLAISLFALLSSVFLLGPLLLVLLLGPETTLPLLNRTKAWLFNHANRLVALVSLALAGYLLWKALDPLLPR